MEKASKQLPLTGEKPLVVMDAGISTKDNLTLLRSNKYNYDYICVSKTVPKEYNKLSEDANYNRQQRS